MKFEFVNFYNECEIVALFHHQFRVADIVNLCWVGHWIVIEQKQALATFFWFLLMHDDKLYVNVYYSW